MQATRNSSVACIGLGSNLGSSLQILQDGWQLLGKKQGIRLQSLSLPYRTKPVDMESSRWFINAVGLLTTSLPPEALLEQLLSIEHEFGRRRKPESIGYQDRTLDLDILLYDNLILETPSLNIPHPELHKRLFVLVPLADLVPKRLHPRLHKTIDSLKRKLLNKNNSKDLEQVHWPASQDA